MEGSLQCGNQCAGLEPLKRVEIPVDTILTFPAEPQVIGEEANLGMWTMFRESSHSGGVTGWRVRAATWSKNLSFISSLACPLVRHISPKGIIAEL